MNFTRTSVVIRTVNDCWRPEINQKPTESANGENERGGGAAVYNRSRVVTVSLTSVKIDLLPFLTRELAKLSLAFENGIYKGETFVHVTLWVDNTTWFYGCAIRYVILLGGGGGRARLSVQFSVYDRR